MSSQTKFGKKKSSGVIIQSCFLDHFSIDDHLKHFERLATQLASYPEKCNIDFIDDYKKTERRLTFLNLLEHDLNTLKTLSKQLAVIASKYRIKLATCSEEIDLSEYGITPAICIDHALLERMTGKKMHLSTDSQQRKDCGCIMSVDIGVYNTCKYGCLYC